MRYPIFLLFTFLLVSLQSQTFEWAKQINGAYLGYNSKLYGDHSGNVYMLCGGSQIISPDFTHSDSKYTDSTFVIKYGADGTFKWMRRFARINEFDCGGNRLYIATSSGIHLTDLNGKILTSLPITNAQSVKAYSYGFFVTHGRLLEHYNENGQLQFTKKFFGGMPVKIVRFDGIMLYLTCSFKCDTVIDGFSTGSGCDFGSALHFVQCTASGNIVALHRTTSSAHKTSVSMPCVTDLPVMVLAVTESYSSSKLFWYNMDHLQIASAYPDNDHYHTKTVVAFDHRHGSIYALSNDTHFGDDSSAMQLLKYNEAGQMLDKCTDMVGLRGSHLLVNEFGVFVAGHISHSTTIGAHTFTSGPGGQSFFGKLSLKSTGLSDLALSQAGFFPNPTQSTAYLRLNEAPFKPVILEVYDVTGRPVACHYQLVNDTLVIDAGALGSGFYTYKLRDSSKNLSSGKFLVE